MKYIVFLLALFLVGCATYTKKMPTNFCGAGETENCRPLTPGMREGSSRGHSEEPKDDKLMYYIPPEQLWPEDFPSKPQVCASPFQGRLLTR